MYSFSLKYNKFYIMKLELKILSNHQSFTGEKKKILLKIGNKIQHTILWTIVGKYGLYVHYLFSYLS